MLNAAKVAERKARARRVEDVEIKALDGEVVRIRAMNLLERDDYNIAMMDEQGNMDRDRLRGNKARLIATCVVDETGATFLSAEDAIAAFDCDQIDEIFDNCQRVNGMKKKAVEEAAGNS